MPRSIRLQPYESSAVPALHQGMQLNRFVKAEGKQFAELWPDKVRRYGQGIVKATRSVQRIGAHAKESNLWAFVIEEDTDSPIRRPLGIGTVALEQAIVHPDVPGNRQLIGTDIDYVLAADLNTDRDTHDTVARRLLQDFPGNQPNPNAGTVTDNAVYLHRPMRTTIAGEPNPPYGMTGGPSPDYWQPFGQVAPIGAPGEGDLLGMAKGGRPLQLYLALEDLALLDSIAAQDA